MRAFAQVPPDRGEIGKAIYKIGRCFGSEDSQPPGGADAAALADLTSLSALLETLVVPATAPATALPAPPLPRFESAGVVAAFSTENEKDPDNGRGLAAIDELLLELERSKPLAAPLSRAVNAVFIHVLRAIETLPPDRREIADAIDKINLCLEIGRAERREPRIVTTLSHLVRLSSLLESQLAINPVEGPAS